MQVYIKQFSFLLKGENLKFRQRRTDDKKEKLKKRKIEKSKIEKKQN